MVELGIVFGQSSTETETELVKSTAVVTWGIVYIQPKPFGAETSKTAVDIVKKGDNVIILKKTPRKEKLGKFEDYWYKVRIENGKEGWIFGNYIIITDPINQTIHEQQSDIIEESSFQVREPIELVHGGGESPVFSLDGESIAFNKKSQIYVMDKNGNNLTKVKNVFLGLEPSWSPDSKSIVFRGYGKKPKDDTANIWTININGTNLCQLTFDKKIPNQYPKWSPDGNKIVWTHNNQLWIMDKDGKNQRSLTTEPAKKIERCCDWSPNGKEIIYIAADTYDWSNGYPYKTCLIQRDSKNQRIILKGIEVQYVQWSKKGNYFFYSNAGNHLMKIDIEEKEIPKQICNFGIGYFDISFDEKWILSDDNGPGGEGIIIKSKLK
jgi:hypothetical protein